jgi:tRNA (guanine-N7-)-methyltransferase
VFKVDGDISPAVLLPEEQIGRVIDWQVVFGNDRPVQMEIGPGKGRMLKVLTQAFPQHNFLAIEWANEFYRMVAHRLTAAGITNAKMLRTDAREFVIDRVPTASVWALHIYFPDPWPKDKHHKRRLFIPEFCRQAVRVLKPGGKVLVATDHAEYFSWLRPNLLAVDGWLESDPAVLGDQRLDVLDSNYQAKFVREGESAHRMAMEKRA